MSEILSTQLHVLYFQNIRRLCVQESRNCTFLHSLKSFGLWKRNDISPKVGFYFNLQLFYFGTTYHELADKLHPYPVSLHEEMG